MSFLRCAICIAVLIGASTVFALEDGDAPEKRWDDGLLGFTVTKPTRGRYWKVASATEYPNSPALQVGDEILSIDGKRVSLKDDVPQLLKDAGEAVEIRASRKDGRKKVRSTATFKRRKRIDAISMMFKVGEDPLNKFTRMSVSGARDALSGSTYLLPELIFRDGHPSSVVLRFQYRAADWIFVHKLTIKNGDEVFVITCNPLTERKSEVLFGEGIREWFAVTDDDALAILKHIGTHADTETLIRIHGKDFYKDVTLSKLERVTFRSSEALWRYGKQREADLSE